MMMMALGISMMADSRISKLAASAEVSVVGLELEGVRRKNEELERELREREERGEAMRRELERTRERLRTAEEAEEMLCSQLGELEAEALDQAMASHRRIRELTKQLNEARRTIGSV